MKQNPETTSDSDSDFNFWIQKQQLIPIPIYGFRIDSDFWVHKQQLIPKQNP
jgi:hypothetical protein